MIPRWFPRSADLPRCVEVTPRWSYFSADEDEFDRRYLEQLHRYGVDRIHARLAEIAKTAFEEPSGVVCLLCYERDRRQCHRGTFAEFWMQQTGEIVGEVIPK